MAEDVEQMSASGSEVMHKWMQELDRKNEAHTLKAVTFQKYAVSQRAFLLTWCTASSVLAMTRFAMYEHHADFVYSIVLFLTAFILFIGFGIGWLEKSTFHLQMAHRLAAVKARCYSSLKKNEFDSELKQVYENIMTQSNNMMHGVPKQ